VSPLSNRETDELVQEIALHRETALMLEQRAKLATEREPTVLRRRADQGWPLADRLYQYMRGGPEQHSQF
jgi:hypothetical protein